MEKETRPTLLFSRLSATEGLTLTHNLKAYFRKLSGDLEPVLRVSGASARDSILDLLCSAVKENSGKLEEAVPLSAFRNPVPAEAWALMAEFDAEEVQRGLDEIRSGGGFELTDVISDMKKWETPAIIALPYPP